MTKVLYLTPRINLEETPLLGVKKKILGQVDAFKKYGLDALVIDAARDVSKTNPDICVKTFGTTRRFRSPIIASRDFVESLRDKVRSVTSIIGRVKKEGPVVLYVRRTSASPGSVFLHLVLRFMPNVKRIYLEIPTWPYHHETDAKFSDRIFRPLIGLLVHKVVTYSSSKRILGVKTIRITNGVSAEDNPLVSSIIGTAQELKIVFVGQLHIWTGLDRLLAGLVQYVNRGCKRGNVKVHIAGDGQMLEEWMRLSAKSGLNHVVDFHGGSLGEMLENIYAGAHLAIGNLGNHRRKLSTNADLKNREYCMRGIPFITATGDSAFPDTFMFLKREPADDSYIDIESIIQFYESIYAAQPDYKACMRAFAMVNLRWETTMLPVIQDIKAMDL